MAGTRAKRFLAVLLLLAMALSNAGCWDRSEIDEMGYILALGVDPAPKGDWFYTIWLAVPRKMAPGAGGGGGGGGGAAGGPQRSINVTTVEAANLGTALQIMNAYIARRLTLEHAKAIVVGEAQARSDIISVLAPAARFREFRRNTMIVVTRGTARDFLELNVPSIEANPSRWLELMLGHEAWNGFIPRSTAHQFLLEEESEAMLPLTVLAGLNERAMTPLPGSTKRSAGKPDASGGSGSDQPAPPGQPPLFLDGAYLPGEIPRSGANEAELIGAAVFRGTKMVGELNGDEVRLTGLLRGRARRFFVAEPDPKFPGYYVGLDIRRAREPSIRVSFEGERPIVDVNVRLEGEITSIQSFYDWTTAENLRVLQEATASDLEKRMRNLVKRSQQEFQGDIFDFGDRARGRFLFWKDWADYDWNRHFPQAQVNIQVTFELRRVGLQLSPPPPPEGMPQPGAKGQGQGGGGTP